MKLRSCDNHHTTTLPLSLKYIIIHCGTNYIWYNDPQDISGGLIKLAGVIEKKYKDIKIIISSLLPRDKSNSQKRALAFATNIYLKEERSFNMLLLKNDHFHLTKFGYEKLSSLFVKQLN